MFAIPVQLINDSNKFYESVNLALVFINTVLVLLFAYLNFKKNKSLEKVKINEFWFKDIFLSEFIKKIDILENELDYIYERNILKKLPILNNDNDHIKYDTLSINSEIIDFTSAIINTCYIIVHDSDFRKKILEATETFEDSISEQVLEYTDKNEIKQLIVSLKSDLYLIVYSYQIDTLKKSKKKSL